MGDKRFLAILAALLAAVFRTATVSPQIKTSPINEPQAQRTSANEPSKGHASADDGILRTFSEFDKTFVYASPLKADGSCDANLTNASSSRMDWVIATVPDPQRSNLKLDFDREIEAIQDAAESGGYQFERFWFPWHAPSSGSSEVGRDDAGPDPTQLRESGSIPGVLLFRQSEKEISGAPGLAVFLVGETPTSGINPGQFRYATCLGRSLHQDEANKSVLHIVGPCYSASFDSLAILSKDFREVIARSWTTDLRSQRQFTKQLRDRGQAVDLRTSRVPSIISINSFVRFIRDEWGETGPIVLLKEEGTALGAGIKGNDNCDSPPDQKSRICIEDPRVVTLGFPRNLSTLRNASESETFATAASTDSKSAVPRIGLTLSLKGEPAAYEIPRFSPAQTPVSQESVLFTIAGLLKTGTVHYLGIIASDPLDVLYLSRYLRSACPNLRLFTLDPDLLFEHGSDSADYQGILGVGTYPLFPISQIWTGSRGHLQIASGEDFEAVYNSVLASLAALHPHNTNPSLRNPNYLDLRNPFELQPDSRLPLWLTVAGRSGFQPVTLLSPTKNDETLTPNPGTSRFIPELWDSWTYLFLISLTACLLFCCAIAVAAPEGERALSIFSVKAKEQGAESRALYLSAVGLCLALLTLSWLVVPEQIIFQNLAIVQKSESLRTFSFSLFFVGLLAGTSVFALTAAHRRDGQLDRKQWTLRSAFSARAAAPATGFSCSLAILGGFLAFNLHEPTEVQASSVLGHLWYLIGLASFVLGATLSAAACPVCDLLQANVAIRKNGGAQRAFWTPKFGTALFTAFIALSIVAGFVLFLVQSPYNPINFLSACRALDLTSGISPLVPITLLIIILISLAIVHLRRIVYFEDRCPAVPEVPYDPFLPSLSATLAETRARTSRITFTAAHAFAFVGLAILVYAMWTSHTHQTLESSYLETVLIYGSVLAGFLLVLVWIRVLLLWISFSEFLQELERHPLRTVFSLLPKDFVWSPVWQGGGKKRTHVVITRSLECILALEKHEGTPKELKSVIRTRLCTFRRQVTELLQISASRRRIPVRVYRSLEENLSAIAAAAANQLELNKWNAGSYELKSELASREETKGALEMSKDEFKEEEPNTICGELIAFRFLAFINYVLWQIDNLVGFLSFGFLLLVIALNSYDFRSRTIIDWILIVMFLFLTSGIMTVFAQAARDAILSRITGTQEGKLDRNFFIHLLSYGGMPVLVLAATHFPTLSRFLFSWVKPALEAIH